MKECREGGCSQIMMLEMHRNTHLESSVPAENRNFNVVFGHFALKTFFKCENRYVNGIFQFNVLIVSSKLCQTSTNSRLGARRKNSKVGTIGAKR